ncbi:alanine racemase [Legionella cincinnatiensis]|uniref:Alanine racemase n=1 Tax=Legionella cincinnatiensis TaxID=28085 RepID=A0A378IJ43_9GAMM|nr:alanine racemase [Legionella cincinnatiensis]KTC81935.1 alanine racemase [Legionella cincinnatiensis]STX34715.1 alanine racemase [Legionella cincinnatiensis]
MNSTKISTDFMNNYIIMGGGPVGCYLAYTLLSQKNARVFILEGRAFERLQVIRIPFCIAKNLPEYVKNIMWADEETRLRIFNTYQADDENFWPKPGYPYWPWINIGLFQESMINFLQNNPEYKNRFFFIPVYFDLEKINYQAEIKKILSINHSTIIENITAIYCTCGTYAKSLRGELNLLDGKISEPKGHGVYLIYQNKGVENYLRNSTPILYTKLGENGISYAASNNCNYDVQLYTYPAGELSSVLNEVPEDFIHRVKYNSLFNRLDMTGRALSENSKQWFENYKKIIVNETNKYGIELPSDLEKIEIFYASRSEYYWNRAAIKVSWQKNLHVPLFFIGDSAGSTDYKFGLSVGRGFLAVDMLINSMQYYRYDFDKIASNYQTYWNKIIFCEFNKGPLLSLEPWIQYQYLIKGREVQFHNNKRIHYIDNDQYEIYLDEYQHLSTDFSKTSETSSILFINTKAIKENIENIISFGKHCSHSKIIGVIKSNGYGLGSKLVSDLAIEAGIDFLAVAKLQEAIALRNSGIPSSVRLMTFEAPMIYDLSTYAANQIEVILPSSKNAASVKMIEKWLQNKHRILGKLKVHIMVDTGLRRDGGYESNIPDSVMETISKLQLLDPNQVEFAGLSTHLACYRCTDYNGDEIINFRSLQFHRLKEVIKFLFLQGIHIPLIHIGGGLALLAEKWPLQFEKFSKEFNMRLYTRVGHGLYGMELEKDLHLDSPRLRPVVQMDLQVRNVFYVEEGEPVSYGGYWRAPKDGAWIATLAGGWAEGVPRTAQTLGEWQHGIMVCINNQQYPIVGKINMNAMMVNLGSLTKVKPGDRAIIFGWRDHEPKLNDLAQLSGQIAPSIMVNVPFSMPRVVVSE